MPKDIPFPSVCTLLNPELRLKEVLVRTPGCITRLGPWVQSARAVHSDIMCDVGSEESNTIIIRTRSPEEAVRGAGSINDATEELKRYNGDSSAVVVARAEILLWVGTHWAELGPFCFFEKAEIYEDSLDVHGKTRVSVFCRDGSVERFRQLEKAIFDFYV